MAEHLRCFVVDDDEIDRLTTLAFLEAYPYVKVEGVYDNAVAALAAASQHPPDVMFLDIDMPCMSGLELRAKLLQVPACIFITAYPEYAVESFEQNALDFLVKPFKHDRFEKTMQRVADWFEIRQKAALLDHTLGVDSIFIKEGTSQVKLPLHRVIYLEALNNYTGIVTTDKKHMVLSSMSSLIHESAFRDFIRIHRSYAVQKHYIKQINAQSVVVDRFDLPVGRSYKDQLDNLK